MPQQNYLPNQAGADNEQPTESVSKKEIIPDLVKAVKSRKILNTQIGKPIFLSVSEAAKLTGIGNKTVRRAIESTTVKFIVKQNRYFIDIGSLVRFMLATTKRKNKFNTDGLGQYVDKWKE
jgi:excisionase family DNA binding protein